MGKHINMIEPAGRKNPEEFAMEVLGTADEQAYRWYEQQISWRQSLVDQYQMEIGILCQGLQPIRERILERKLLQDKQAVVPPDETDPELAERLKELRTVIDEEPDEDPDE